MAKSNSERFYEGFQRFLAQSGHEQPTDDEMDALLQEYVKLVNEGSPLLASMAEEESADVFLDRAQEAKSRRERLKWIRKAREIEPDHVDAALAEIEMTVKNPYEEEMLLFELQQKAEKQLREQGDFGKEAIGDFWLIVGTRPYMRVCHAYVETLLVNRKMRLAAKECESMLRLCSRDNLGIRYTLIHIYAYLEEEKAAQKIFKKYHGAEETRLPLAMALLSYKLGKEEAAQRYLQMLLDNTTDVKKFFSAYGTKKMETYTETLSPYSYRPHTMEELFLIFTDHLYAYGDSPAFFFWAKMVLRGMKRSAGKG